MFKIKILKIVSAGWQPQAQLGDDFSRRRLRTFMSRIIALALKVAGGDGAPVRAVAIENDK